MRTEKEIRAMLKVVNECKAGFCHNCPADKHKLCDDDENIFKWVLMKPGAE